MLASRTGVVLKFAEISDQGQVTAEDYERQFTERTRFVAVTGMSNVIGTVPPVAEIVERAHARGAVVLLDAAQAVAHHPIDIQALGVDFVAFSGHKLFGPTGVGVLCAKPEHLEAMPPVLGGGGMVVRVERGRAEWIDVPWKFEAGTPPIAQAIGLGAAIDYVSALDRPAVQAHEGRLLEQAHRAIGSIRGARVHGLGPDRSTGLVGFTIEDVHPHDVAQILDRSGVAIRAGHHCAMPLHARLGLTATARASFAIYNTLPEVDRLAEAVEGARRLIRRRA
jgi:cysteine desulfurase/selenocysteine lyase